MGLPQSPGSTTIAWVYCNSMSLLQSPGDYDLSSCVRGRRGGGGGGSQYESLFFMYQKDRTSVQISPISKNVGKLLNFDCYFEVYCNALLVVSLSRFNNIFSIMTITF